MTKSSITSVPIRGGPTRPVVVAIPDGNAGLALSATNVVVGSRDGQILSTPLQGGTTTVLAAAEGGISGQVSIDSRNVYWLDTGGVKSVRLVWRSSPDPHNANVFLGSGCAVDARVG
jgi:hypothetical protein